MTYSYHLDDYRFRECAEAVVAINPNGCTVQSVMDQMTSAAYGMTAPGYVGTGGWYVTAFVPDYARNQLHFLPTVMPYCVNKYVERVAND